MKNSPLIFIHYGNSKYLKYVFRTARHFNPEKRIILIGDEKNKKNIKYNIEHFFISDFDYGKKLELFDKVYKYIAGPEAGHSKWTKFVFRRWFIMYNFVKSQSFDSFWTMDSDNMILTDLSKFEGYFSQFDCTEQCNGSCMNGFISNLEVVKKYLDKINELFTRENYLENFAKNFIKHPRWAFTEMQAYRTTREEEKINSFHLGKIHNNSRFDDILVRNYDTKMNIFTIRRNLIPKQIFFDSENFYEYNIKLHRFIKLNSTNLSWVPIHLFETLYNAAIRKKFNTLNDDFAKENNRKLLDFREPLWVQIIRYFKN
jgi:hypothetical protein